MSLKKDSKVNILDKIDQIIEEEQCPDGEKW